MASMAVGKFWNLLEVGEGALGVGVRVFILVDFFGKTNPSLLFSWCLLLLGFMASGLVTSVSESESDMGMSSLWESMMLLVGTSRCPSRVCVAIGVPLWRCRLSTCRELDRLSGLSNASVPVL